MSPGNRLREFRTSQNLGLRKFATRLGVSASMLAFIEQGSRAPGLTLAVRIEQVTASWPLGPIRPWEWVGAAANGNEAA
jgi:transcriptional regulator with XRE-family HTH domain